MIANNVSSSTGTARALSVGIARDEPSHIHIPRPSRVMRPEDTSTSPRRPEQHLEASGDLSTALAFEDVRAA